MNGQADIFVGFECTIKALAQPVPAAAHVSLAMD